MPSWVAARAEEGRFGLTDEGGEIVRETAVVNREGLHARPVMRFVDLACRYRSRISVTNVTKNGRPVDGKGAMQMMLLEATQGSVLRISAIGEDARDAAEALVALVASGFPIPPDAEASPTAQGRL